MPQRRSWHRSHPSTILQKRNEPASIRPFLLFRFLSSFSSLFISPLTVPFFSAARHDTGKPRTGSCLIVATYVLKWVCGLRRSIYVYTHTHTHTYKYMRRGHRKMRYVQQMSFFQCRDTRHLFYYIGRAQPTITIARDSLVKVSATVECWTDRQS